MKWKRDPFLAWIEAQARLSKHSLRVLTMALLISVILIGGWIFTAYTSHEMHRATQHNEKLYKAVMSCDLISFMMHSGNPVGYQNYYKWHYAKWRQDPKRTRLEKFLFWDKGIFYDASNPPAEYQYSFLGTKN